VPALSAASVLDWLAQGEGPVVNLD